MASFDFDDLSPQDRYKLLIGTVVPRPIAWVTTVDGLGRVNAAPFSFFNALCSDPPIVAVGMGSRPDGSPKDSPRNIAETGVFTVNIVSNDLAEKMNVTATTFDAGVEELAQAGLTAVPGTKVASPRIGEAPAALECRVFQSIQVNEHNVIVLGEVVAAHYRDGVINPQRLHVDPRALDAIARLGGNGYATSRDIFDLARMSVEDWEKDHAPVARKPR